MKNPLKVAAYSGLLVIIIPFFLIILNTILRATGASQTIMTSIAIFNSLIITTLSILFTYGFIIIAKKHNAKLLLVMSWIGIIFGVIFLLFSLFANFSSFLSPVSAQSNLPTSSFNTSLTSLEAEAAKEIATMILIIFAVISLILGIYTILFGIGLLKLKEDVKYAKPAGILNIVSGATYIILIGWLVQIAAFILELLLLFNASNELEAKHQ